ncbi:MAG TPA: hypothetical protein VK215_16180 [Acidimicrobiales bacterium]|nr:hypothetical protein [Acidimicrobiales bacterium]
MKTANRSQMLTDPEVEGDGQVLTGMWGDIHNQKGVVAVVVERDDGTCVLFFRGSGGTWPSSDEAKNAVDKISAGVVWRESTGGVWVARADLNGPEVSDRATARRRRSEPGKPAKTSATKDTYMAARVLRGTVRFGHSRNAPPGSRADSGVLGERRAG